MNQHDDSNIEAGLFARWERLKDKTGVNIRSFVDNYSYWDARDNAALGYEASVWHRRQNAEDRLLEALEAIISRKGGDVE